MIGQLAIVTDHPCEALAGLEPSRLVRWDEAIDWGGVACVVFVASDTSHVAALARVLADPARAATVAVVLAARADTPWLEAALASTEIDGYVDLAWPPALIRASCETAQRHAQVGRNVVDIQRVVLEQTRREAASLYDLAAHDDLTGLHTRRHIREVMEIERARCSREGKPYATIFVDVDDLRRINTQHGHAGGSKALRAVGQILRGMLRAYDVAGRVGGDEFVVFLSSCDRAGGAAFADRLRERIADAVIDASDGSFRFTVSIGVASYPEDGTRAGEIIERADRALYRAKAGGKNRTVVFGTARDRA